MIKGIPLTLGDGKEYVIAPLTLGAFEDLSDAISSVGDGLGLDTVKNIVDVVHRSLQRNYPKMTRDEVRELLDLENMQDVFTACMDVSGAKRKEIEAGEAKAVTAKRPRR